MLQYLEDVKKIIIEAVLDQEVQSTSFTQQIYWMASKAIILQ